MLTQQQIDAAKKQLQSQGVNLNFSKSQQQPISTKKSLEDSWAEVDNTMSEIQKRQAERENIKNETLLEKGARYSDKFLGGLSKITGVQSAIDLGLSASKGLSYSADRAIGDTKEEANKKRQMTAETDIEKSFREGGTIAGLKNIAGKSLEVGLSALPFVKGAGVAAKGASELSKAAKYGKLALEGAGYGGAFGASNALQENKNTKQIFKDIIKGALTGAVVSAGIPAFAEGTARAAKNVASLYSGVPKDAIERAFANPQKVGVAVKAYAKDPENTRPLLDKAEASFDKIKEMRSKSYQKSLEGLKLEQNSKLNLDGVKSNLNETLNRYDINGDIENGFDFSEAALTKEQEHKVGKIVDVINGWKDTSPAGLNKLGKKISAHRGSLEEASYNSLVDTIKNNLKDYVHSNSDIAAQMDAQYTKDTQFIDNLKREIFGNGKASDSTKLMRLLSIFNKNTDIKRKLVGELGEKAGQDLLNEITGAAMANWLPTGWIQRFVLGGAGASGLIAGASLGKATLAIPALAAAASPRIVGKIARVAGSSNEAIQKVRPQIEKYGIPAVQKLINPKKDNK